MHQMYLLQDTRSKLSCIENTKPRLLFHLGGITIWFKVVSHSFLLVTDREKMVLCCTCVDKDSL